MFRGISLDDAQKSFWFHARVTWDAHASCLSFWYTNHPLRNSPESNRSLIEFGNQLKKGGVTLASFVRVWEILESPGILCWHFPGHGYKSWKVLEICKLHFDNVIFTVSIVCGTACKAYSKDKVIVDVATGWIKIKCGLGSPGKRVKKGTDPD